MADDLNQPYIGYRSAGRRRPELNDRAASADAPLALLRGVASGVLGAPGDIESLVRMLPGLSEQTFLPTSEDIERRLPLRSVSETPVGRAATGAGQIGGGFYTGPGSPLRAIAGLPSAMSRAGRDFAMAAGQPAVNVVKPKGGNFLAGTIERVIEPMKTRVVGSDPAARLRDLDAAYAQNVEAGVAMDPAVFARERARLEPEAAMNRWLETKLGKYFEKEMATPEDPLRALAESWPARQQEQLAAKDVQIAKARADMEAARAARGFTPEMMTRSQARIRGLEKERELIEARGGLHYDPTPTGYSVSKQRIAAGFPEEGMAQSDLAKRWEKRADTFFNELQASDLTRGYPELVEKDPWLAKVPPETRVYELLGGANEELGMQHLVDELKNAINPSSGLPPELLLKYTDLEKKTVPDIVNQVADINAWRAMQKAEADRARAMNAATHLFKEYPEQGLRWVELKLPEKTGKNVARTKSAEELEMAGEGVETMSHDDIVAMTRNMARDEGIRPGTQEFNDMLQENIRMFGEKPSMVDESEAILADALKYEGELLQHCVGGYCPDVIEGRSKIFSLRDKKGQPHVTIEVKPGVENPSITEGEFRGQRRFIVNNKGTGFPTLEEAQKYAQEISIPDIVQIKGLLNRAPAAEYLPAVQDFVRSGKWSRVGDLQNTGLYRKSDFIDEFKPEQLDAIGRGEYVTMDEIKKLREGKSWKPIDTDPDLDIDVSGFAEGGLVGGANFPTYDFDPARIDSIVGELHAMNAG